MESEAQSTPPPPRVMVMMVIIDPERFVIVQVTELKPELIFVQFSVIAYDT